MQINRKIVFVFAISLIIINSLLSQNKDSLFDKIKKTQDPKELISIYNSLGNSLRYSYPDSAMVFFKKSLNLSILNNDILSEAEAYGSIGTVWAIKNIYDSSQYYLNLSLTLNKKINNEKGQAKALNSLGLVEMRNENADVAKKYFLQAVAKEVVASDSALLSKIYNNLGLLFKRKHNFDSALYYYHESLKIKEYLGDSRGIGLTTNNIALIYEKISEFDLALLYLNRSLKIRVKNNNRYGEAIVYNNYGLVYESQGKLNKALANYKKSLEVMEELNKLSRISTLHNNLGSVYVKQKNYKKGFKHLQKGLEISRELGNSRGQIHSLLDIAEFYEDLKIYQNSITQCQNALVLLNTVDDMALTSETYENLYYSYEMLNKFDSALFYYKKYSLLNDSIFNTYSRRNIEKLELEYQTLKKEKENQDLIRQNNMKENKLKITLLSIGVLILIILTITIFGFFYARGKTKLEKTYQLVLEQRNNIQHQSNELKDAYQKLQELSKFKEELTGMIVHDLKNPLNTILNVVKINNFKDKEHVVFQSGKQMMNLVMNILDIYKYEGKSFVPNCKELFINPIIKSVKKDLAFVLSEKSIKIETVLDYNYKAAIDETTFERIVTNLLTNAIKFSPQGSVIKIVTEPLKNNRFRLHVIDKGRGIATENIDQIFLKFEQRENRKLGYSGSTGIGLTYCKMAIEAHNGIIGVESEIDKGSDFFIEMDYIETVVSEINDEETEGNYILLSNKSRQLLNPHIKKLEEKDIYEVTEIRKILASIEQGNKELQDFCGLIENSVLNCNQHKFDELIKLALS